MCWQPPLFTSSQGWTGKEMSRLVINYSFLCCFLDGNMAIWFPMQMLWINPGSTSACSLLHYIFICTANFTGNQIFIVFIVFVENKSRFPRVGGDRFSSLGGAVPPNIMVFVLNKYRSQGNLYHLFLAGYYQILHVYCDTEPQMISWGRQKFKTRKYRLRSLNCIKNRVFSIVTYAATH